jgi:bacterial/archaeal transporter family-2 protein
MKYLAVFAGMLIAVMVSLNGELSRYYPPFLAVLIFNLTGLVCIAAVVLIRRSDLGRFKKDIPLFFFLPGIFSVLLTFLNNICFREIGVSVTLALAVVGQSIFSAVIDSFGLMTIKKTPFDKQKIIGFLIIGAGIFCILFFRE